MKIAPAGLAVLLLAGCSGGGASLDSPKAIATELGCASSFQADTTEELGVEQVGSCDFEGDTVRLLTFASNDARDTFVDVAKTFGSRYVSGDGYTVEVNSADSEKAVRGKLE